MLSKLILNKSYFKGKIIHSNKVNIHRFSTTSRHNLVSDNSSHTNSNNSSNNPSGSNASSSSANSNQSFGTSVTVNAYYIARRIDLIKAHSGLH